MPPRKRKIATVQQDELPRNTRRSAKRIASTTPQCPVAKDSIIKNSVSDEASLTHDNRPAKAKMIIENRQEITDVEAQSDETYGASSSESDWEEVEDLAIEDDTDDKEPNIPKESIEITIELPEAHKKRRAKKEFDMATYVRRKISNFKKEVQESMHKVHLLCLLGHGIRVNCMAKEDTVLGVALSLIPDEFFSHSKKKNKQPAKKLVESLMNWFKNKFLLSLEGNNPNFCIHFGIMQLLKSFENGSASSEFVFVIMFLVCIRIIGLDARLIISLQPIPFKLAKDITMVVKKSKLAIQKNGAAENVKKIRKVSDVNNLGSSTEKARKPCRRNPVNKPKNKSELKVASEATSHCLENEATLKNGRGNSRRNRLEVSYNEDSESDNGNQANDDTRSSKTLQKKAYTELEIRSPKQVIVKNVKKEIGDSDEDFRPDLRERQESHVPKGFWKNRQALSLDNKDQGKRNSGEAQGNTKTGTDQWLEVYDDSTRRWICVDCLRSTVDQIQDLEDHATKPISYVLSFDGKGYIKDVTQRYASNWLSHARKLRVDADWWLETLKPYKGPRSKRDKLEDEQLEDNLLERPLPTTISEFKNHPLYALKRHLLKFEGIYPPEAAPVGFIRGEPIYARECVKELHSRETWLKEARLVRIGETAYKVVKARPKWIRVTGEFQTDLPLDLFGEWQTDVYVPPKAQNGKVPRNDYGNVELFKPSMLPKGTVHLQIPGLNRVAKKLGIDCAAAMIGWDFHGGGSHPTFDGWVVCKEFKATLLEAWDEEQVNIEQREKEKREKRVYGNWRRLIRGLLIKERIRIRYAIDAPKMMDDPQSGTSKKNSGCKTKPRKRKNTDM